MQWEAVTKEGKVKPSGGGTSGVEVSGSFGFGLPLAFWEKPQDKPLRFFNSSVRAGTTLNRSPTIPKSDIEKIGASASLLIATMFFDVCIPALCWMAPDIPQAM